MLVFLLSMNQPRCPHPTMRGGIATDASWRPHNLLFQPFCKVWMRSSTTVLHNTMQESPQTKCSCFSMLPAWPPVCISQRPIRPSVAAWCRGTRSCTPNFHGFSSSLTTFFPKQRIQQLTAEMSVDISVGQQCMHQRRHHCCASSRSPICQRWSAMLSCCSSARSLQG